MKIEELIVCPLSQIVYIIEPSTKEADMYKGYLANIPKRLMNREIHCMYAAYAQDIKKPVLVIDIYEGVENERL